MKRILSLSVVLCALASVRSGEDGNSTKAIAPYLDEQTAAVARIDVAGADVDAILEKVAALLGGAGAHGPNALEKRMVSQCRDQLVKAGAKEAYVVWSLADKLGVPFGVVRASSENAARALAGEIRTNLPLDAEAIGSTVLIGSKEALARLRDVKPASFPELPKAFAAAGQGTFQAVLIPPATLRRAVMELIPRLPKELGEVPVSVLDRGIVWIAVSANVAPKMSLRYVVQSRDEAAAKDLAKLAGRFYQSLFLATSAKEVLPEWKNLLPELTPKAEGDRVILSLDGDTINKLLVPAVAKVREAAARTQSMNNIKQMLLAMHNYSDVYKSLPAYASFDKDGKPLLSWRVHILPFLEQQHLYQQFHLDEPWDSEHNKQLIGKIPFIYRSPLSKAGDGKTVYLVPMGKQAMFGGKKGINLPRDIPDGTSNTIMLVEANDANAVVWTKPGDFKVDGTDLLKGLLRPGAKGFGVGMADGSVRLVSKDVTLETLRAAFTRNGGEVLGQDW